MPQASNTEPGRVIECQACNGSGQDNDGESFIDAPCPKCDGGGFFVTLKEWCALQEEIKVLRLYGNKDCTAMADDELRNRLTKEATHVR